MHIRELMRQRWAEEGLYASKKSKLRAFLAYIDEHPEHSCEQYIQTFREQYYDLLGEIVPPLLATNDKLLRLMLIRNADVTRPKELKLLKEVAQTADPTADEPELLALARLGHKSVSAILNKRADLSLAVRDLLVS